MKEKRTLSILLADDDEDDRMLFADIVEQIEQSIALNTVDDGEQLIQALTDDGVTLPDVIFLDLNMPNKNGKECLKEIKAHDRLKHLPVIIYSTSAAEKDVREAYNDGATLYIQKPSNIKGLKKTLTEVLSINWKNGQQQFSKESFLLKTVEAFRRLVRAGMTPLSYQFPRPRTSMQ
ncbi:MAG TPA: response regulator [Chitinophagaceae bacterium]|jgi:CheY-like chemotaxis protein